MCSITRLTHRWFWFTSQVSRVPPHPANPAQQSGLSNPHQSSLVDSGSLSLLLSALQPVLQYVPFSCLYRFVPAVLPSILYCHCQSCRSKGLFYSILLLGFFAANLSVPPSWFIWILWFKHLSCKVWSTYFKFFYFRKMFMSKDCSMNVKFNTVLFTCGQITTTYIV